MRPALEQIARTLLKLVADSEPEMIDPTHPKAGFEGLAKARSGNYASAADVEAAFRRFDK